MVLVVYGTLYLINSSDMSYDDEGDMKGMCCFVLLLADRPLSL